MSLISLLVIVILLLLIYWAIHRVADALGAPPIVLTLLDVVLVVVFVLYLLQFLGLTSGWVPPLR